MQNIQNLIRETARLIREAHKNLPGQKFVADYGKLMQRIFPSGYIKTFEKIQAGDGSAIEFGLVYLEVQPYFFRSQYHRTRLIRKLKHAPLSSLQAERLKRVLDLEHHKKINSKSIKWKKIVQDIAHEKKLKGKTYA